MQVRCLELGDPVSCAVYPNSGDWIGNWLELDLAQSALVRESRRECLKRRALRDDLSLDEIPVELAAILLAPTVQATKCRDAWGPRSTRLGFRYAPTDINVKYSGMNT